MSSLLLIFIFCSFSHTFGANILFLNGVASPSHHIYNRALVVGLADKGHNVTFVSVDISTKQVPNIHYIHLEKTYEVIYGTEGQDGLDLMTFTEETPFGALLSFNEFSKLNCDGVLASNGLEVILSYPNNFKFDVVIYDFSCGPCLLPLIHKFNYPPLIAISAFGNPPYSPGLIGGQKYPAYIPHYLLNYPTVMTFSQRFHNTILYAFDKL